MAISSVTGVGQGAANNININKLIDALNGPRIIFAGKVTASGDSPMSPPGIGSSVKFPYSLPGGSDHYVVSLTGIGTAGAYIAELFEDEDENFTGFSFGVDSAGEVMYIVSKAGMVSEDNV